LHMYWFGCMRSFCRIENFMRQMVFSMNVLIQKW
jgi:hypothetical protein